MVAAFIEIEIDTTIFISNQLLSSRELGHERAGPISRHASRYRRHDLHSGGRADQRSVSSKAAM
jgi:hypothetical protein